MSLATTFQAFRGHRTPNFPIVQRRRTWFLVSGAVLALALVGLFFRGLNYSIDFTGGSIIQLPTESGVTVEEIRDLLAQEPFDRGDAEIQVLGGDRVSIRTTALTDLSAEERTRLTEALAEQAAVPTEGVSIQVVGPTWGAQITRQALIGLAVVLVAITIYVSLRFEWKMAIAAIAALVHDVVITAGVYALTGREVSPPTVIAVLTILGFSLYDSVVIYDRVQENTESSGYLAKDTYEGVANLSMNQVLMRSINTSLVVVLPILSLLLLGAYSSIFVAVPILVILKEREPRYRQHRARLERRTGERPLRALEAPTQEEPPTEPAAVGAPTRTTPVRPRPKTRRKPPAKRRRR
jgi:preprotein translocase subunit SecF